MNDYHDTLSALLSFGTEKGDRTGTGTKSMHGVTFRHNFWDGFPAVTTKKLFFRGVAEELFWFLSGSTNVEPLQERGVNIWNEWADEDGELGPVYGKQWRDFNGVDQIANVVESLRENPLSRRHIVSAWNAAEIDEMALPPCHLMFQFLARPLSIDERRGRVDPDDLYGAMGHPIERDSLSEDSLLQLGIPKYRLDCIMYQRSADWFLGVPFNIASYALLTHMMAQVVDMIPGQLVINFGDAHLYQNHLEQAREQLSRTPKMLPELKINKEITDIDAFGWDDVELVGYEHHPAIKAPISV